MGLDSLRSSLSNIQYNKYAASSINFSCFSHYFSQIKWRSITCIAQFLQNELILACKPERDSTPWGSVYSNQKINVKQEYIPIQDINKPKSAITRIWRSKNRIARQTINRHSRKQVPRIEFGKSQCQPNPNESLAKPNSLDEFVETFN